MNHDLRGAPQPCPWCGATLSAACNAGPEDDVPGPGDFSVCLHCAQPLRLDDALHWNRMSQSDLNALSDEERQGVIAAMATVRNAPEELRRSPDGNQEQSV